MGCHWVSHEEQDPHTPNHGWGFLVRAKHGAVGGQSRSYLLSEAQLCFCGVLDSIKKGEERRVPTMGDIGDGGQQHVLYHKHVKDLISSPPFISSGVVDTVCDQHCLHQEKGEKGLQPNSRVGECVKLGELAIWKAATACSVYCSSPVNIRGL